MCTKTENPSEVKVMSSTQVLLNGVRKGDLELYQVWLSDGNDNDHACNVLIEKTDYETLDNWLVNHFIKTEYQDDIQWTDNGFFLSTCDPDECIENTENTDEESDNPCDGCQGETLSVWTEQITDPDISDLSYHTIYGTNEFYIITGGKTTKSPDHDKTLSDAWKKGDSVGLAALLLSTHTPQEALSPELKEKSIDILKKNGIDPKSP